LLLSLSSVLFVLSYFYERKKERDKESEEIARGVIVSPNNKEGISTA
jgi:hypothetical protein